MPRIPKPKVHHTKVSKMAIKVRSADLARPAFKVENTQTEIDEFVYIDIIHEFFTARPGKKKADATINTNNKIRYVNMWTARTTIGFLDRHGIAFDTALSVKEMIGSTNAGPNDLAARILRRLPENLTSAVGWIVGDGRRFLVVTNGSRNSFGSAARNTILRTSGGKAVLMTDDEEQAITIKLKHGGSIYDLEKLREEE